MRLVGLTLVCSLAVAAAGGCAGSRRVTRFSDPIAFEIVDTPVATGCRTGETRYWVERTPPDQFAAEPLFTVIVDGQRRYFRSQ